MPDHPTFVGRYRVVKRLSSGGMGVLYLARDPAIDRPVAVKVARVRDAALRQRFVREARAAGRLRHRNIVTIFDVGEQDGEPFIAMEYVPGPTLAEIVQRNVPLPILQRLRMMRELCDGLAHAHAAGIVHRDIKPANLIAREDSGSLTILDFGIARLSDSTLTGAAMLGTLHYMAPEQIDGRGVDHRCDIFSAGVVFYEMLSYRRAFGGDTTTGVMYKIAHETPVPLSELVPELDPALIDLVGRAIAKRAEDRYQQFDEMLAELDTVMSRIERDFNEPHATVLIRKEDPAAVVERRTTRIAACLEAANVAIDTERWQDAQETLQQAALLDPDDERVQQAIERLDATRTTKRFDTHVVAARTHLANLALTRASESVEMALQLRPESPAALQIQRDIEIRQSIDRWLEAAERHQAGGEFTEAAQAADEVLKIEPAHETALRLKHDAEQAARAWAVLNGARRRCKAGDFAAARQMLEEFDEPHDLVKAELAKVEAAIQEALNALESDAPRAGSAASQAAISEQSHSDTIDTSLLPPPVVEGEGRRQRSLGVTIFLAVLAAVVMSAGLWLASSGTAPARDVAGIQSGEFGPEAPEAPGNGPEDATADTELPFAELVAHLEEPAAPPPAPPPSDTRNSEILTVLAEAVAAESAGALERAGSLYARALAVEAGNPLALDGRQRIQASIRQRAAREILRQANAAFDDGRYVDARRLFQDAFDRDSSPEATAGLQRITNMEAVTCHGEACGRLLVRVAPPADIFVDDRALGTGTALELNIRAGRHRIRLETDDRRFPRVFEIAAGETVELNVDLEADGFPK